MSNLMFAKVSFSHCCRSSAETKETGYGHIQPRQEETCGIDASARAESCTGAQHSGRHDWCKERWQDEGGQGTAQSGLHRLGRQEVHQQAGEGESHLQFADPAYLLSQHQKMASLAS